MARSTDRSSLLWFLPLVAVLVFVPLVILLRPTPQQAGSAVDRPDTRARGTHREEVIQLPHDEGPPGTVLGEPGGQHTKGVFAIIFTPEGKTLASASADGTVRLWDPATGRTRAVLPDNGQKNHRRWVTCLAVSPEGTRLASGSGDGTVRLWDVKTCQELGSFKGLSEAVHSLAFSPDGKTLAVGGEGPPIPLPSMPGMGELKLWDMATRSEVAQLEGYVGVVNSVAFTPDGKTLLAGSSGIGLWDVATGKLRDETGKGWRAECLSLSGDGRLLAWGTHVATVALWDVEDRRDQGTLEGHRHEVYSVAFTRDGQLLATASEDRTVKLWDVATRKELVTLADTENRVAWCVTFSQDGKRLAAGVGSTIKVWDVHSLSAGRKGE
jgi:WD40 repeat protein